MLTSPHTATAGVSNRQQLRRAPPRRSCRLHVVSFLPGSKNNNTNKVIVNTRQQQAPPPPQLIKEEQQSLQAARKSAGLSDAANVADISPSGLAAVLAIIKAGVNKKEQDLQKLEGAMLLAEQLFHAKVNAAGGRSQPQAVDVWQVRLQGLAGGVVRVLMSWCCWGGSEKGPGGWWFVGGGGVALSPVCTGCCTGVGVSHASPVLPPAHVPCVCPCCCLTSCCTAHLCLGWWLPPPAVHPR